MTNTRTGATHLATSTDQDLFPSEYFPAVLMPPLDRVGATAAEKAAHAHRALDVRHAACLTSAQNSLHMAEVAMQADDTDAAAEFIARSKTYLAAREQIESMRA
jgi:hypothetical protein